MDIPSGPDQAVELGQLLAGAVTAVVEAQDVLDAHAEQQRVRYAETPSGTLVVPPLWYAFRRVSIDVELSAEFERQMVRRTPDAVATLEPRLKCRVLNPTSVGLYGYRASSGLKVHLSLEPQGLPQIKPAEENPPADASPSKEPNHGQPT
jgi:hypothetical protein